MSQLPAVVRDRQDLLVGDRQFLQQLQASPSMTEAQWRALEGYFHENAASPIQPSIICEDADCPYYKSCPLVRAEIPRPVGKPCVIEETVKRNWRELYLTQIGDSIEGNPAVDTGMIIDLVSTLLDIHRAQMEVAESPRVAERVLRGYDAKQNPIVELKMNPVHFFLKNARQLKVELLEQLVATRDARKKDKSRDVQDQTRMMTEMRGVITNLREKLVELAKAGLLPVTVLKTVQAAVLPGGLGAATPPA
jgi:hypothetical protein